MNNILHGALITIVVELLIIGIYFLYKHGIMCIEAWVQRRIHEATHAGVPQDTSVENTNLPLPTIVAKAADFVSRFEGFRAQSYTDLAGNLTIGYGQRIGLNEYPDGITEPDARKLLETQLNAEDCAIYSLLKTIPTDNQNIALLSFVYNLGTHAFASSTLLKKINAGAPLTEIQAEFLRWDHANGQEIPGLKSRRQAEANMYGQNITSTSGG